jgi:hypothetical protein
MKTEVGRGKKRGRGNEKTGGRGAKSEVIERKRGVGEGKKRGRGDEKRDGRGGKSEGGEMKI